MNPFTFQTTPNVLFEAGASRKLPEIVGRFGAKARPVVTDKGVRGAGLTQAAEAALAAAGVSLDVYEDVVADPPSTVIEAAAKRAGSSGPTWSVDRRRLGARYRQAGCLPRQVRRAARRDLRRRHRHGRPPCRCPRADHGRHRLGGDAISIVTTPTTEKKGRRSPRNCCPGLGVARPELTLAFRPLLRRRPASTPWSTP